MNNKFRRIISFALVLVYILGFNTNMEVNAKTIEKAPIYMMKSISDGKEQVLLNDTFEINYKFQPQDILASDLPNEHVKKHKNIVLVVDTSGSMDFDIDGKEIKNGYYGWAEINKASYRNNSNYKIVYTKVTKNDNWDERKAIEVNKYSGYDFYEDYALLNIFGIRIGTYRVYYKYEYYKCKYYQWKWIDSKVPSRLDLMKGSLDNFLDQIKGMSNVKLNLVEFNTDAKVIGTNYYANNNKNINTLKEKVNGLKAEGGTNLGLGMYMGYNLLDNNNVNKDDYLILLTDGEPTYYSYYIKNSLNYYYFGEGTRKVAGPGNTTSKYTIEYAKLVGEYYERNNNNTKDVKSYYIAFADKDAGNKLSEIADYAGAYYKKAMTSDALSDVYNKLAEQIVSDVSINDIYFEETFSNDFEIVSYPEHMKQEGNTIKGEFGSINYNLDSDGKYFVASPIEFKITLKAKKTGEYILGNNNYPYNSYIKYKDMDDTVEVKPFAPIQVSIYEDKPPIISALLTNDIDDFSKSYINVNIDENASIYIYDIHDNLIAKEENGTIGDNTLELSQDKLIGNYIKIVAKDKYNNTSAETVPIVNLVSIDFISIKENMVEAELIVQTQLNSKVDDLIINSILVDRNKFVDEFGQYKNIVELENDHNTLQIKVTNEYGNSTIYNFTSNMNYDREAPIILTDYIKNFIVKDQGEDRLTIYVESNGTGSEILETHYIKLPDGKSNASISDFSDIIGTNKNLLEAMTNAEIDSSIFKNNKNNDFYRHEKFNITENGYYAIYAKDKAGNEQIRVIMIGSIVETLPELL